LTEDETSVEVRLRDLGQRLRDAERARNEAHADELAAANADDDGAFHAARNRRTFLDDKIAAISELMAREFCAGSDCELQLIPLSITVAYLSDL
jgi:hypothetical protein